MENIELDYRIIRLLKNKWGFTDIGITNNISVFVAAQVGLEDFFSWQERVFERCNKSLNPQGYLIQAIRNEIKSRGEKVRQKNDAERLLKTMFNNKIKEREMGGECDIERLKVTFDNSKVAEGEMKKYQEIHLQVIERGGWFTKTEVDWLSSFEKKAKLCNDCKSSVAYNTLKGVGKDRYGNDMNVGYMETCISCLGKRIIEEKEEIWQDYSTLVK